VPSQALLRFTALLLLLLLVSRTSFACVRLQIFPLSSHTPQVSILYFPKEKPENMNDQNQNEVAPVANANDEQLVAPRLLQARALAALPQRRMRGISMLAHVAGVMEEEDIVEPVVVAAPMVNAAGDVEAQADMAALVVANENNAEGNATAAVFLQALWALLVWLFGAVVFVLYHGARQILRALPYVRATLVMVVSNSVQLAWPWLHGTALPRAWGLVLAMMRLAGVGAVHLIRWLDLAWTTLQVALSRVYDLILGWPQLVWTIAIYCLNQFYFAWTWTKAKVFHRVWDFILALGGYFVTDADEQDDQDEADNESLERVQAGQKLLDELNNFSQYQECLGWCRARAAENHGP